MASKPTIAAVLAYLHELYPTREIGSATAEAWAMTFAEWDDATFQACARLAAGTRGRTFFPTPGEIAALRPVPAVDSARILHRISAMGTYTPSSGWILPRLDAIRDAMGDAIADAYAVAGAERCFAGGDGITQEIARRAFSNELLVAQRAAPELPLLAAPTRKQLAAGVSA